MRILFTVRGKNIDLLYENICDADCPECFFKEEFEQKAEGKKETIIDLVKKLKNERVFFYPREPTTDMSLLDIYKPLKQTTILTNGKQIVKNPNILERFKDAGIKEIKFTLFANAKEQKEITKMKEKEYLGLRKIVKKASKDFKTEVFNILYTKNIDSMESIAKISYDSGVDRITFLRLTPISKEKGLPKEYFITSKTDGKKFVKNFQKLKEKYDKEELYISSGMGFGPDFFTENTKKYLSGEGKETWASSNNLCPSINGNYLGISINSGKIYPCFKMMGEPQFQIGELTANGDIEVNKTWIKSEDIKENITGDCKKCDYLDDCLGGCRSVAYIFAKQRGEKNPLYAGMDICRTQIRKEIDI
ncbi:MAG: SPASM domain-containing protein [archaeon]